MSSDGQSVSGRVEVRAGDHILISDIDQSHDFRVSSIPQVNWVA